MDLEEEPAHPPGAGLVVFGRERLFGGGAQGGAREAEEQRLEAHQLFVRPVEAAEAALDQAAGDGGQVRVGVHEGGVQAQGDEVAGAGQAGEIAGTDQIEQRGQIRPRRVRLACEPGGDVRAAPEPGALPRGRGGRVARQGEAGREADIEGRGDDHPGVLGVSPPGPLRAPCRSEAHERVDPAGARDHHGPELRQRVAHPQGPLRGLHSQGIGQRADEARQRGVAIGNAVLGLVEQGEELIQCLADGSRLSHRVRGAPRGRTRTSRARREAPPARRARRGQPRARRPRDRRRASRERPWRLAHAPLAPPRRRRDGAPAGPPRASPRPG